MPPKAEIAWWYQYYFATERGRIGYEKYRRDFAKLIWQIASPKWDFDDVTFDRSAASFDNPDHVSIVIHNCRWRLGLADGEPKYDDLEKQLRMRSAELNIEFGVVRLADQWVVVVSRAGRSVGSECLIEGAIECGKKTSGDYRNRGDYTDWDYERGD